MLENTRIDGQITRMYHAEFPIGSELAHTLPVHCPLTYEKLASYAFDPNAELLLALELIGQAR